MQWIPEEAPCTRSEFVDYLIHTRGLGSVDIPMSTCPNHVLPLFAQPQLIHPEFYEQPLTHEPCPRAQQFFERAIKVFIPVRDEDFAMFQRYIDGFLEATQHFTARG